MRATYFRVRRQFTVEKGDVCVLLGPSGSGKSTLLNIIGAIDKPGGGYVAIGGDKLQDMDEKHLTQYRRLHLGYVFQMYNLIPNLNVKENVEVGAHLSALQFLRRELRKQRRAKARRLPAWSFLRRFRLRVLLQNMDM